MKHALKLLRSGIILLTIGMFLLGQMFAGEFTVDLTLAGLGGFLAAGLGLAIQPPTKRMHILIVGLACLSMLGVVMNAVSYYSVGHPVGAYYPWGVILFYCGLVVMLAAYHVQRGLRP